MAEAHLHTSKVLIMQRGQRLLSYFGKLFHRATLFHGLTNHNDVIDVSDELSLPKIPGLMIDGPPIKQEESTMPKIDFTIAQKCKTAKDCVGGEHVSCVKFTGKFRCICIGKSGDTEPLVDGKCIMATPVKKISASEGDSPVLGVLGHDDIDRLNRENFKNIGHTTEFQGNAMPRREGELADFNTLLVLKILLPILGVIIIVLAVLLFLKKRGIGIFKVTGEPGVSNSSSQVVWMSRNPDNSLLLDSMSLVNKNPTYYAPHPELVITKYSDKEIPPETLVLMEEIGEGAFGQVFRGDLLCEDGTRQPVAVKLLKNGVSLEIKEDFEREVEIMSTFDHDNILKLIGVVTKEVEETPYMVFEFMEFGDLAGLLRKNDPIMRKTRDCPITLKDTELVDIAVQIANGMVYLTQQHFVHRDLATRNCLVGDGLLVKISDFGMSRDIYTCDYYKIGGSRMLPVRWMSPESVKYGKFTTESDVWAYGVVLWEIFSYGKQPYYGHTNEEVVVFIENHILLCKPEGCPSAIYDMMLECWHTDPDERISFVDIHKQLVDHSKHMVKQIHKRRVVENGHCSIPV
ncbi:BDNF/NT-3 growth factors receptor-like [Tubulanus polymorphus]|uniref:BDNF/NT-3 growth factors receptor-like n=1 Tax=Tubulanus polymorphus TaxID=672921 RepID=UPI003DA521AC